LAGAQYAVAQGLHGDFQPGVKDHRLLDEHALDKRADGMP